MMSAVLSNPGHPEIRCGNDSIPHSPWPIHILHGLVGGVGDAEGCAKSAWSVRQLERQIHTMYYQRILASQDKSLVAAEIQTTEPKPEYEKIIKDPYVMEFLQIQPDTHVYEGELEQALIDHLQHFLLELGRGFSFVARQKKFTLDAAPVRQRVVRNTELLCSLLHADLV